MDSPVSGFSHLQLLVSDLTRSEAWYAAALGLRRFAGGPDAGYLAMSGAGGRFAIVLSPLETLEPTEPAPGLDHLAFAVPTLALLTSWADELAGVGIKHDGLVASGEGTSLHLVDPDGLHLELITNEKSTTAP